MVWKVHTAGCARGPCVQCTPHFSPRPSPQLCQPDARHPGGPGREGSRKQYPADVTAEGLGRRQCRMRSGAEENEEITRSDLLVCSQMKTELENVCIKEFFF